MIYSQVLSQTNFVNEDELMYPFQERGLQFGDGIYEVIRVYQGKYYLMNEHVDRLFRSAEAVKLTLPFTKEKLFQLLDNLLKVNQVKGDAKVYLQATRGSALRDHVFPDVEANFYAYVQELPRPIEKLTNGVAAITQPDVRWQNCYIKSLNLLPNVLAKQEAKERGAFEAILHRDETVTECSSSNVYIVKDGKIHTHPETNNILHGCVRSRVKVLARQLDISIIEKAFSIDDLQQADEVFLSSSTAEVMPIVEINGNKVHSGEPGPVTKKLQKAYEEDAGLTTSIFAQVR
ncbi:D-amino-acid transaminase [Sediminibacillus dalangtanensis]|uniref:D-alanine aminotransferase n=1 Tax=Sediminibacillus dalangtanensis TaxID=2729421 RepID=A0ABX7VSC6_9BACI|nr:D-amino-acid transaminase [Sediminibacillus dalangtanensis]QTM98505.1 D-amino-acid transaminase [Sediminibacillus dalangtanensis]